MAHQKLHICFQFPATIPETKSQQSHWRTKLAHTSCIPLPFSRIIFSFTGKETCLITPFIRDEARLRSASLPPFPTAVTVCPSPPPALCRVPRGEQKEGKGPTLAGLRCGIRCQSRPRLSQPKGHIMFGDSADETALLLDQ